MRLPLTPLQAAMLAAQQLAPARDRHLEQWVLQLPEPLDPQRWHRAWQRVWRRHPALRAGFGGNDDGTPYQWLGEAGAAPPLSMTAILREVFATYDGTAGTTTGPRDEPDEPDDAFQHHLLPLAAVNDSALAAARNHWQQALAGATPLGSFACERQALVRPPAQDAQSAVQPALGFLPPRAGAPAGRGDCGGAGAGGAEVSHHPIHA